MWTRALLLVLQGCWLPPLIDALTPDPLLERTASPWERPDERPVLNHPMFDDLPELTELARFAQYVRGPYADRPAPAERGPLGVGNGRTFALVGLADPVNTLHGLVGPVYRKQTDLAPDIGLQLVVDGVAVQSDDAWWARPRHTAIVVTRADHVAATLFTADVALRPAGSTDADVPAVLWRRIGLAGRGGTDPDLSLELVSPGTWEIDDGVAVHVPAVIGDAFVALVPMEGSWTEAAGVLRWDQPDLATGEAATTDLAIVTAFRRDELDAAIADVVSIDADAAIAATLAWWADWSASGVQLDVGDPWFEDWLDGLRVQVRVQVSHGGGVSPLSRYTGSWLRDTIGPVRFFTRLGLQDEALAMVRYLELCHTLRGDVGNSCTSGLLPVDVALSVNWSLLTAPFPTRLAAEGPSYVPLAWKEVVRWTGDVSLATERWPYLRRTILGQTVDADGHQGWSGDETFRLPMEVALGAPLATRWEDGPRSSNSAFVYLPAARFVAEVADAVGAEDDAEELRGLADRVRVGLDDFLEPEGHFAAVRSDDPELAGGGRPFEDSSLKAIWSGALSPSDPVALDNLTGMVLAAGQGDGLLLSPSADRYRDNDLVSGGVATGMLPSFTLWNLAATGHAQHAGAFDELLAFASPSGSYPEGLRGDTRAAYQLVYDAAGGIDLAARYRPWEGGIVADAALSYVLGAEPSGTIEEPGLSLRPRLVNGTSRLEAAGLRAYGVVVDLSVAWDEGTWELEVRHTGGEAPIVVTMELPLEVWEDVEVEASGDGRVVTLPLGERIVRWSARGVEAGGVFTWRVAPR